MSHLGLATALQLPKIQQCCNQHHVASSFGNIDLLSAEDRADLIDTLARDPMAGDVMPGLGGVRKLRFAPKGRGKSGGFRVIYYVLTESQPILALLIYGKNEQGDLSQAQRKVVAALAAEMKQGAGS